MAPEAQSPDRTPEALGSQDHLPTQVAALDRTAHRSIGPRRTDIHARVQNGLKTGLGLSAAWDNAYQW
jgi:hypothetical protein